MRSRLLLYVALVASGLVLVSCRGCLRGGPREIRELASTDAAAALVVADWQSAVGGTEAFATRATAKAAAALMARLRENLKKQLGIDALDPKAYDAWGLDAHAGLMLFAEGQEQQPLFAIGVGDEKKFNLAMQDLIARLDGANKLREETIAGFAVQSAGRPFGSEVVPTMYWVHVGRFAIIAPNASKPVLTAALTRLAAAAKQGFDKAASLATDPIYASLAAKVPKADAVFFVRGTLGGASAAAVSNGAVTGLHLSAAGFDGDTFVNVGLTGLEQALSGPAPADLAARVENDATLILMTRVAKKDSLELLRKEPKAADLIDRTFSPLRNEVGLDPEKDIVPLLAGPLTVSAHVTSLATLPEMQRQRSLAGALDLVQLVLTAEIKDPKALGAALETSREALAKRGVKVKRSIVKVGRSSAITYVPEAQGGAPAKIGWALIDNLYVYAAGVGRLERQLALLAGTGGKDAKAVLDSPVAGKLVIEPGATVIVARLAELANAASTLQGDPKATAMGIGAAVGGLVELLRTLGDVALSVKAEPDGLRFRVREQLQ